MVVIKVPGFDKAQCCEADTVNYPQCMGAEHEISGGRDFPCLAYLVKMESALKCRFSLSSYVRYNRIFCHFSFFFLFLQPA